MFDRSMEFAGQFIPSISISSNPTDFFSLLLRMEEQWVVESYLNTFRQ